MTAAKVSRKERELALRQALVFEAAEAVLVERGFHGASVDEIAKRAGLSVGTLYNLFGNKERLYAALMERGVEEMRQFVRARVAGAASSADKLHAAIDAMFDYFAEHERTFRVYVSATHGLQWNILPQFGERVFARMQAFSDDMTGWCRQAVRGGALPRIDPALLAMALLGTINAMVTRWVTERRGRLTQYQAGAHAILSALGDGRSSRRPTNRAAVRTSH
ncbi:MAG: TetR family transcriptional regulator [Deltaproteobacteria bacterium]|nr:TetR family transcriptional regulator [Deltaproteobacteria bacterium]